MDAKNVTAGKPKTGGAVFHAPEGTDLPTDVTSSLDGAFKAVGYCSTDGVTNTNSPTTGTVKAWGGDTVLSYQSDKPDLWKVTLIEAMNEEALKAVYGSENVTGTLGTGISVKAGAGDMQTEAWVFDIVLKGGAAKRIVLPRAKITEVGDVLYKDDTTVGYPITLTAEPDAEGYTHYEYIKGGESA